MNNDFLDELFRLQYRLQQHITGQYDVTSVKDMYGAATGAMVEIGEMLQSDTRWKQYITKSKKDPWTDIEQFVEEWADVIIYMINVLVYAGIDIQTAKDKILEKVQINAKRFGV